MYRTSVVGIALVGASVFSLARAQVTTITTDVGSSFTATRVSPDLPTSTSIPDEDGPERPHGDTGFAGSSNCFPGGVGNMTDWNAPCPAFQAIQAQCGYGPYALEWLKQRSDANGNPFVPDNWQLQPADTQRACFCSSQYIQMVLGCGACLEGHGLDKEHLAVAGVTTNETTIAEWSDMVCDVDATLPEEGPFYALQELLNSEFEESDSSASTTSSTATASDSIGNKTDISLYFTPSVSSAYLITAPTVSSSAGQNHSNAWFTFSSLSTSDGHIVPTAEAAKATSGNGESGDATASGSAAASDATGTTTAAAGAMQTAMVYSGIGAGALGFAVLALAL